MGGRGVSNIECTTHAALTDNYSVSWMCERTFVLQWL